MNGGNITFYFKGDTKDIEKDANGLGSKMKSIAGGMAKGFGVALGASAVAISGIVTASVNAFAEFEQLEGGLVSVFGEGSNAYNQILQSSKDAYKDLTMSQNEYLTAFEGAYPIITNGLGENKDAIEYTNKALQLSSDLYNTYGGSIEQYSTAINWALKGTFSYVDNLNLGIKGTAEGFVEAANKSGILGRSIKDVSELTSDEIVDVIAHYADEYGVLGKTAQEAGTTIQGSLNMTKSAWSNLLSGFSQDGAQIETLVDQLITSAMTFANNLIPVVNTALSSILSALPTIINTISTSLPGLMQTLLPPIVSGAVALVQGLVNALPQMISILASMLPTIIQSLLSGLVLIIQTIAQMLPELIPVIIDAILGTIPILIDNLPLFINAGWQLITGLLQGIIKSVPTLLSYIPTIIKSIINYFKQFPSQMLDIGKNLIKGLWNGIKDVTGWITDKIKGFGKSVLKSIKGIFGIHSPSTEFAFVGRMNAEGLIEGMEGMEKDVQQTFDGMFDLSPQLYGTSSTNLSPKVNVVVNNEYEQDPLGQMVQKVRTFSGGAKNDFNYGYGGA